MKILLTNDDGFDAPGLAALKDSVVHYGQKAKIDDLQIWVVAPDRGRSECGHSVTTGRDLCLREHQPNWFSLDGTPVDCVRVALTQVCPDVDVVFSGINAGANVGIDLLVSGTLAAAREAVICQKPAMAVSHYRRPDVPKTWDHTPSWLFQVITRFIDEVVRGASAPELWNVNLPAISPEQTKTPPIYVCPVDQNPLKRQANLIETDADQKRLKERQTDRPEWKVALQSDFHGRPRSPGTDVELCFSGGLTISKVSPGIT